MSEILDFIRENAVLVNLGTFGLGLWLGNRLAIGRDKRIEWNELTETKARELRSLVGHRDEHRAMVEDYLPFYLRWGYRRALDRYQQASQDAFGNYDVASGMALKDPAKVELARRAAVRLLRYYRRR